MIKKKKFNKKNSKLEHTIVTNCYIRKSIEKEWINQKIGTNLKNNIQRIEFGKKYHKLLNYVEMIKICK